MTAPEARADSALVAILEKTNQQLSLWWNPYGVLIAALGVMFAIGAIVAGLLLFRQSREHREILDAAIARYEGVLDALVRDKLTVMEATVQESLADAKAELATGLATGLNDPQRGVLERKIGQLEVQLAAIKSAEPQKRTLEEALLASLGTPAPPSAFIRAVGHALSRRQVTCSKCGTKFQVVPPTLLTGSEKDEPCPNCGAINKIRV